MKLLPAVLVLSAAAMIIALKPLKKLLETHLLREKSDRPKQPRLQERHAEIDSKLALVHSLLSSYDPATSGTYSIPKKLSGNAVRQKYSASSLQLLSDDMAGFAGLKSQRARVQINEGTSHSFTLMYTKDLKGRAFINVSLSGHANIREVTARLALACATHVLEEASPGITASQGGGLLEDIAAIYLGFFDVLKAGLRKRKPGNCASYSELFRIANRVITLRTRDSRQFLRENRDMRKIRVYDRELGALEKKLDEMRRIYAVKADTLKIYLCKIKEQAVLTPEDELYLRTVDESQLLSFPAELDSVCAGIAALHGIDITLLRQLAAKASALSDKLTTWTSSLSRYEKNASKRSESVLI